MGPSAVVDERRQKKNKKNKNKGSEGISKETNKKSKKEALESELKQHEFRKNKGDKSNKERNEKETPESEMKRHESQDLPKKNKGKDKKRKLESSLEITGDDEMRDNSGTSVCSFESGMIHFCFRFCDIVPHSPFVTYFYQDIFYVHITPNKPLLLNDTVNSTEKIHFSVPHMKHLFL